MASGPIRRRYRHAIHDGRLHCRAFASPLCIAREGGEEKKAPLWPSFAPLRDMPYRFKERDSRRLYLYLAVGSDIADEQIREVVAA